MKRIYNICRTLLEDQNHLMKIDEGEELQSTGTENQFSPQHISDRM
jgi:hypothetical protein